MQNPLSLFFLQSETEKLRGTRKTMEASNSRGCTEDDELTREELDFTERLPEELFAKVLSGFTLEEAARTSVLSRRWRNLWKSADCLVLDFDGMKELKDEDQWYLDEERILEKRLSYMKCVNEVLTQLQQHNCKASKFRLAFNMNKEANSNGDIDRWLLFAISKRVESLDLSFDTHNNSNTEAYVFSEDCYNHIKTGVGLSEIKFLRSLRLLDIDVRDKILEHFIANCPSLEELAVESSASLTQLRVVGSSYLPLQLKHLEVITCNGLEFLEINHTPHLVRFVYGTCLKMKEIRVGNCPGLVDLALIDRGSIISLFELLSGCASQLESLFLKNWAGSNPADCIHGVAEHTRLRQLTIKVHGGKGSLLTFTTLINKCPHLHTLQVLLCICNLPSEREYYPPRNVIKTCRESIKVVEIAGFNGYPSEVEFVEYVMDYFVCLERIVIDQSRPDPVLVNELTLFGKAGGVPCLTEEESYTAERAAFELKSRAAPTLEFIVI